MEDTKLLNQGAETVSDAEIIEEVKPEEKKDIFSDVPKKSFSFNVDDEIQELQQPKQDYTDQFEKESEDFEEDLEKEFFEEKTTDPARKSIANKSASLITRWFDTAFAFVLMWWAKDEDFTKYKAEKPSLKVIEESFQEGLLTMEKPIKTPWWIGLFIEIPIAYFPKLSLARKKRKEYKAMQKMKERAKKQTSSQYTPSQMEELRTRRAEQSKSTQLKPKKQAEEVRICLKEGCDNVLKKTQKKYCCHTHQIEQVNFDRKLKKELEKGL